MQKLSAVLFMLCTTLAQANDPLTALKKEVGRAGCEQDSQCRVLALGLKSCGGPELYWPWSVAEGNADKIGFLAKQYAEARAEQIKNSGELSDCSVVSHPAVVCSKKQCVLKSESAY
ncbi:hypothetical protein [Iodobacter fluviatilis]|jgi:hypothetical protein|uniref:DUF4189 domain-containing protein n=1 Tax=Iodobacter fluviatilis TaxID=537 RepID=A0A7G3G7N3_9NEIS|nr:hypothetical protein [Iodobacter fluviatilis]QBC42845.1 hypothetical protein C1H71_04285 [Iodobacter fluviatilis]